MTERELSQAVHLKTELDALRRVAALEPNPEVLKAIDRQARAVELARLASQFATDEETSQPFASRALKTCNRNGIEFDGEDMRRKKS